LATARAASCDGRKSMKRSTTCPHRPARQPIRAIIPHSNHRYHGSPRSTAIFLIFLASNTRQWYWAGAACCPCGAAPPAPPRRSAAAPRAVRSEGRAAHPQRRGALPCRPRRIEAYRGCRPRRIAAVQAEGHTAAAVHAPQRPPTHQRPCPLRNRSCSSHCVGHYTWGSTATAAAAAAAAAQSLGQ
jgi:hypothetical protein